MVILPRFLWLDGRLEEVFEERNEHAVGLGVRGVSGTVGHEDTVLVTKEVIDPLGMFQDMPSFGRILAATGDEERARGHQDMKLVKIPA